MSTSENCQSFNLAKVSRYTVFELTTSMADVCNQLFDFVYIVMVLVVIGNFTKLL